MKTYQKLLALMLGSVLAISLFAGCDVNVNVNTPPDNTGNNTGDNSGNTGDNTGNTGDNTGNTDTTPSDPAIYATICYDNLPDDGISLDDADMTVTIKDLDVSKFVGRNAGNKTVDDYSTIATYDEATGVFTAVSAGSVTYTDSNGQLGRVTCVPAYVENPGNQYVGQFGVDMNEQNSTLLGNTHDPSFIEVNTSSGGSTYYLFSTGWDTRTDTTSGKTYGNAIHSSTDLLTWRYVGRTFSESTINEDFLNTKAGKWLYDGITMGYSSANASWWAPDIVPAPNGGYWLYTCVVDGAGNNQGMSLTGGVYARACILLYYADSIRAGSFKPVKDSNGDPVVLMQSSILRGESVADVNGIDPQIIYSPDGKMYMAYGSFGSGNYMIELDPATGMRKDGKGWQEHNDIRQYVEDVQAPYNEKVQSVGWEHPYYGKNISKQNMEAPVIARHDNVTIMDENETVLEEGKTYYYTMHSYDGLSDNYQMWGGRSEDVWGIYKSTSGEGIVHNVNPSNGNNQGNKYMGAFKWETKTSENGTNTEYDIILPGHNDLFTTAAGTSLAAYITRIPNPTDKGDVNHFVTQVHQYYLNSYGNIVINPNRYSGEIDRAVSEEELLKYTQAASGGYKFKMVVMINRRDTQSGDFRNIQNVSRDVLLKADHTITEANGTKLGTWKMYGKGYIKFEFDNTLKGTNNGDSGDKVFYGVVRPAWLGDQNKSGFTITCMGQTENTTRSMAMFMNNYSTLTGGKLVG